jgi:hypothetical protein
MKNDISGLVTPIYLKICNQNPWPEKEKMFYLLAANGLFLCRNHQFFQSCVPASAGPGELAQQRVFLNFQYPKLSRRLLELTVGFFASVAKNYNAEAVVMMAWNRHDRKTYLIVPRQRASVYKGYYGTWPIGVEYEVPLSLPDGHFIFGDIHSHVNMSAFSSQTDQHDEKNRPGLHLVIGKIHVEPPEFHAEAIVDGRRFKVGCDMVLAGYRQRAPVSKKYLKQVEIETLQAIQGYWINKGNNENVYVPLRKNFSAVKAAHDDKIVTIE